MKKVVSAKVSPWGGVDTRLADGSWGVRINGAALVGDEVVSCNVHGVQRRERVTVVVARRSGYTIVRAREVQS